MDLLNSFLSFDDPLTDITPALSHAGTTELSEK